MGLCTRKSSTCNVKDIAFKQLAILTKAAFVHAGTNAVYVHELHELIQRCTDCVLVVCVRVFE